jgi:hypothetical protein
MVKCEICGREFTTTTGFGKHIRISHKILPEEYYMKYINSVKGVCKTCGEGTRFISILKGYQSHCNSKCARIDKEVIKKYEKTSIEKYGFKHSSQSEEIKRKKETTNMKNRGCNYPFQSEEVKGKSILTWIENYGCKHPTKSQEVAKKIGKGNKLNFKRVLKRYSELVEIENLIEGPNGEVLGRCKNANCTRNIKTDGYFVLSVAQIYNRNLGINSISDGNYFYCCEECKHECIAFARSGNDLENFINPQGNLNQASIQDLSTWRTEVFFQQLKNNIDHVENFCEICHKTENLVGHHILPQKLYPEFALDIDNGIVLCEECHVKYGHTKGTECSTGNLANKICK